MTRAVRRAAAGLAAAGAALALTAPPASAHTSLTGASPAQNATVAPPAQVVLTYGDPVQLPQVVITDAQGGRHESGAPQAVDNKVTEAVKGTLPNGVYTVGWRVVSPDGHPISGTYKFTVTGSAGAAPAPSASASASKASGRASGSDSSGWLWIGLIALVVVAVGGGFAWYRRSSGASGEK
ncbi:copper resistance CopC family protein [Actinomadura opuntiae]|uniref:copper resistance CopC family protein n=1 Tax=Actinomadura sp. OS1-43 TaxID=604315 RepID=UPI00255A7658|nr:copper resistance CopC family protein [Actinomadura sp. OS1-43]MDL4818359.1 copper resistance protein CopC [Actinomadura sp. OS1-43]